MVFSVAPVRRAHCQDTWGQSPARDRHAGWTSIGLDRHATSVRQILSFETDRLANEPRSLRISTPNETGRCRLDTAVV